MLNGATWFDISLLELAVRVAENRRGKPSATVAVALRQQTAAGRFGVVETQVGVYLSRRNVTDNLAPCSSLKDKVFPMLARDGMLVAF